jgi:serine/threonine protein kinase
VTNANSGQSNDYNLEDKSQGDKDQDSAVTSFLAKGMSGQQIAHYTILRELGKGGQGFVYLARDEKLQQEVALKILNHLQVTNAKTRLRFVREAETASKLSHPRLCAMHEFDEFEGVPCIAM